MNKSPRHIIVAICTAHLCQAAISSRQAAIIGLRDSTPDEFSVVALADLSVGDSLFFGDAGVNGESVSKSADLFKATITSEISAGSILTFRDSATGVDTTWIPSVLGIGSLTVSIWNNGPYSDGGANANISGGDPFLLFTSTDDAATTANATHLFGLNSTTSYTPAGLGVGDGIISRTLGQDLRYTGPNTGSGEELFSAISNQDHWELFETIEAGDTNYFGATPFTVTAVPEPSSGLFLCLSGLGFVCFRKRMS